MTTDELVMVNTVANVIDPRFEVDLNADWATFTDSLYSFYEGNIPTDIKVAIEYYALDDNRGSWQEFLTYLHSES